MTTLEFKAKGLAEKSKPELLKRWEHVTIESYKNSFVLKYCCSKSKSYQIIEKKFGLVCQYEQIER